MSPWDTTTLGELLTRVRRRVIVEPGEIYPAVSVTKDGGGLGEKEPFVGGVTNYTSLFRVSVNDVVVRTITAFESPVGVAQSEHEGSHVSQVFLTYEVGTEVLPAFLRLFFQTPMFWEEMRNRATGTVLRRKTISDVAFRQIPISLPCIRGQRRIVDLIDSVDMEIQSLRGESRSIRELLRAMQQHRDDGDWIETPLGEIADVQVGLPFKSEKYTETPDDVRLLRGDNITPGAIRWAGVKRWPAKEVLDLERYQLAVDDVVVGMDRTWVSSGLKVAVVRHHDLPALLVQRVARITAKDPKLQGLLPFLIDSPQFESLVKNEQTGSAVPHISSKQILSLRVSLPRTQAARAELAERLRAARDLVALTDLEIKALRNYRSALLVSLMNGLGAAPVARDVPVPESEKALT